jgi:DNA-binding LacI/PurR family transcriptional regulator
VAESPEDIRVTEFTVPTMTAREGLGAVPKILDQAPEVTAVFCANDMLALGVLRGLIHHGIKVPEAMSLVGYDDAPFAELLSPPLTTVRQNPFELGRRAAEIAFERLEQPKASPLVVLLEPELMVRESVRRIG